MKRTPSRSRRRPAASAAPTGAAASPSPSLAGRTALVTGSSKGLGKGMAFALAAAGAKVAVNYRNGREAAERTLAELRERGYEAALCRGDVTSEKQVPRLVADVEARLGKVDVLVVNATPDQPQLPIERCDWAYHQQMIDFFLKSPYLLTRAVLPHMKRRRWGRIVNIGSEVFRRGVPNFSPYVAAKGAQAGWTRSMATELAPWNITVNMVSPGWIPVERHAKDPAAMKEAYRKSIPMGRWGTPADVGAMVAFLCSDAAGFVTGQDVAANGGVTVG